MVPGHRKLVLTEERKEKRARWRGEDKMELAQKKVLVFGAGISGIGAAKLLLNAGAEVILFDGNTSVNPAEVRAKLPQGGRR